MKKVVIIAVLAAIVAAILGYTLFIHQDLDPRKAHGTVDIKDSLLSFERSGKIIQLTVEEGAQVRKALSLTTRCASNLPNARQPKPCLPNTKTATSKKNAIAPWP